MLQVFIAAWRNLRRQVGDAAKQEEYVVEGTLEMRILDVAHMLFGSGTHCAMV